MEEDFLEQSLEEKQNMWKSFNIERTDFWISVLYLMIQTITPGFVLLLLIGKDFSTSMSSNLPDPIIGYVVLILVAYFAYTILTTYICFKLKLHKADNFTYSIVFTCIFIAIILLSFAFKNTTLFLIVKFIIVILVGIISLTLAVFFTHIFRKSELAAQERFSKNFQAWIDGEELSLRLTKKMIKHNEKLIKQKKHQEEIDIIKARVAKKVKAKLIIDAEEEYVKNFKENRNKKKKKKKADKDKGIKFK